MINDLFKGACCAVAVAGVLLAVPAAAASITVTPATFKTAIAAAHGGDTLRLVGTFTNLRIQNLNFSSTVTIIAADAVFAGTVTIQNVDNLTIGNGAFNIVGTPAFTKAVAVYGGSNITLTKSTVTGSAGGEGFTFDGTNGATVSSSTFRGLQVGIVFGSVTNGGASRNTVTGAVSDGIDIANSHNVTASDNSCSAGNPGPGVHPDCVQLWSVTGQPLQSHIVVSDNKATGPTQGFTAFSAGGGETNVQIINNIVDTSYSQGVACYACNYSAINYNHLKTQAGASHLTNLNVIGGSQNTVMGNYIAPYNPPVQSNALAFADNFNEAADEVPPDLDALVGGPPPPPQPFIGNIAAVPEPSHWAQLIIGFAAVGIARRGARRHGIA